MSVNMNINIKLGLFNFKHYKEYKFKEQPL